MCLLNEDGIEFFSSFDVFTFELLLSIVRKKHLQNESRHLDARTTCRGPSCDLRWPSWCAHWWFGGLQIGLPEHFGWALHLCPGWRDQTLRCHHSTGDQCGHHLLLAAHLVVGALHQGWSDLWALAINMALSKNRASENPWCPYLFIHLWISVVERYLILNASCWYLS